MKSLMPVLAGLCALATAGCGGPARMEGRYTCTNGDTRRFSPDGIVTYQGRYGPAREYFYVMDGDAIRILRREDRKPAGDNIYQEYVRDGDTIVRVDRGERQRFFCRAGNEQPQAAAMPTPTPIPEPTWTPTERAGTEVAEVLGLRLGDSLADVRRKLLTNADPFREATRSVVSENPDVYERIHFPRDGAGHSALEMVVAYFSAPPQRLIGLERQWSDATNPIPWQKMLAPAVQRYGQPLKTGESANTWFIGPNGRPVEPPPLAYANRCPTGATQATITNLSTPRPRCGAILMYDARSGSATEPVSQFDIKLFDADALAATHRAWAQAAENAAAAAARAKLDATRVPEQ